MSIFLKKYLVRIILSIFSIFIFSIYIRTFAIGVPYNAGDTLDPSCSPGEVNCTVNIIPALTAGSVIFSDGTADLSQDNTNFFWDDTNNRLGIGTATPTVALDVVGVGKLSTGLITPKIYPATDSTSAINFYKADGTTQIAWFDTINSRFKIGNSASSDIQGILTDPSKFAVVKSTQDWWGAVEFGNSITDASFVGNTFIISQTNTPSLDISTGTQIHDIMGIYNVPRIYLSGTANISAGVVGMKNDIALYEQGNVQLVKGVDSKIDWGTNNASNSSNVTTFVGYRSILTGYSAATGRVIGNYYGFLNNKDTLSKITGNRWGFFDADTGTSQFYNTNVTGTLNVLGNTSSGTEILTNGALTSGTSWTATGDASLTSNILQYTHSTGVGTLTQTSGTFANPLVANTWYKFTYTISSVTGFVGNVNITTGVASSNYYIDVNSDSATHTIYFQTNGAPGDFVINIVSSTGSFRLDTLSLQATTTGNINITGILKNPAGTSGLSVNSSGYVGIDMTNPSVALDVTGDIEYAGTITDVSDERLKENIEPITNALDIVMNIEGKYFNMKDTPNRTEAGFIAQNIKEYFPSATSIVDLETGYLGVAYSSLIPVSFEAIKELNLKINDLSISENEEQWTLGSLIKSFFANIENGVVDLYAKVIHTDKIQTKELCIEDVCITRNELFKLKEIISETPNDKIYDNTAPEIILNGANEINLNIGEYYTEEGATATDNTDGNVLVTISGLVDTSIAGTYTITYTAYDKFGNRSSITRIVNILGETNSIIDTKSETPNDKIYDKTAPEIILNGANEINLNIGEYYNEEGATATDNTQL